MSLALKTDLYQVAMASGYVNGGMSRRRVTCEAFARRLPPQRRFMVMAGTQEIKDALSSMRFTREDVEYLRSVPMLRDAMTEKFCAWLRGFRFSGDLWAMAEGELVFPGEPLVRVTAPLPEAQMVETIILSILNHDVKIASKAARVVLAAQGRPVFDFGTRRTHHEAAISVARSAYLAGFAGTSSLEAGKRLGIPVAGTMAHMWVMVFGDEEEAFQSFARNFRRSTLLIDTYDTYEGARRALSIKGIGAVRIDSGDLARDSAIVRGLLDEGGGEGVKIVVSGDLDERRILELLSKDAPIDSFGVGTRVAVSDDVPSLGIVYKAVRDEDQGRPLVKLAGAKSTMPGRKQVFLDQRGGHWSHLVAIEGAVESSEDLTPLLDRLLKDGRDVSEDEMGLEEARNYCRANLSSLASLPFDLSSLEPEEGSCPVVVPHESLRQEYLAARGAL